MSDVKPIKAPFGGGAAVPCKHCGATWHLAKDCPIGDSTTPEVERRKAKAGGCCGAARKTE